MEDVGLDTDRMRFVMQHHTSNVLEVDTEDEEVPECVRKLRSQITSSLLQHQQRNFTHKMRVQKF